jgi:hypothetical protein
MIAALYHEEPVPTLPEVIDGLALLAEGDCVLMMAQAVAWLDPCILTDDTTYGNWDSSSLDAMRTIREIWPDKYPTAVEAAHHDIEQLDAIIQSIYDGELPPDIFAYEEYDVEFDGEIMPYIPLQPLGFYGIEDEDGEIISDELRVNIVEAVGWDMSDQLSLKVAHTLGHNLIDQNDDVLENIGWFVIWLYGVSNNTMFDVSQDVFNEGGWPAPMWEEFDYFYHLQQEAFDRFDQAMAGERALERDADMLAVLLSNARKTRKILKRRKHDVESITLQWLEYAGARDAVRSRTQLDRELLYFRDI